MAIEEEYKRTTRWLGPLFLAALAILILLLLIGCSVAAGVAP